MTHCGGNSREWRDIFYDNREFYSRVTPKKYREPQQHTDNEYTPAWQVYCVEYIAHTCHKNHSLTERLSKSVIFSIIALYCRRSGGGYR